MILDMSTALCFLARLTLSDPGCSKKTPPHREVLYAKTISPELCSVCLAISINARGDGHSADLPLTSCLCKLENPTCEFGNLAIRNVCTVCTTPSSAGLRRLLFAFRTSHPSDFAITSPCMLTSCNAYLKYCVSRVSTESGSGVSNTLTRLTPIVVVVCINSLFCTCRDHTLSRDCDLFMIHGLGRLDDLHLSLSLSFILVVCTYLSNSP